MMYYQDEEGNTHSILEEKNEEIKDELDDLLQQFIEESKEDRRKKFGYRLFTQIDNKLRSYGLMSVDEVQALDYNQIEEYWNKFRDLIAYYNRFFEIIPNKQLFCAYMQINVKIYNQLQTSDDEDIKRLMASINDSFISAGFAGAEFGGISPSAIKMRLSAKEEGHDMVSASEELIAEAITRPSGDELESKLKAIANSIKKSQLPKSKK